MKRPLSRRRFLKISLMGAVAAACAPASPTSLTSPAVPAVSDMPPSPTPAAARPTATRAPAAASASPAPTTDASIQATAAPPTDVSLIQDITQAARAMLDRLDDRQRAKATYAFEDAERFRWHWTIPRNFPRNGLPLRDMADDQKTLAHALLQASVSDAGYGQSVHIMALQKDLGNDPALYYVTVFGAPGDAAWGWRWEGHHLSRQFTILGDQIAATPFFLGAWPTVDSAGLRAMAREEDAALALAADLGQAAIFQPNPLTRHVTQNDARVAPLDPVGAAYSDMAAAQQELVLEIVHTYLSGMPEHIAAAQLERINAAGLESLRFGWAGPLELRRPTYYRLQGPTFLLEHDKSRNGGTHIHSVWRDFERDFGYHLL